MSSCHGLDATTAHPLGNPIGPNCYPHRLFAWLNDVFPHPANELTNGACERVLDPRNACVADVVRPQCVERAPPTLATAPRCIYQTVSILSSSNSTLRILSKAPLRQSAATISLTALSSTATLPHWPQQIFFSVRFSCDQTSLL